MYKVMAADDEPMMRKGLEALVNWAAMDCELAGVFPDGRALLEAVEAKPPDIVISDIRMPRATGIDVAREISERRLPVQVILLTAYADFSYAKQAIQYGVSDYVTKTGAVEGIEDAVKKCIRRLVQEPKASDRDREAFVKAVLDGSLFEQDRVEQGAAELRLRLERYSLLSVEVDPQGDSDTKAVWLTEKVRALLEDGLPGCCVVPMGRCRLCVTVPETSPEAAAPVCARIAAAFLSLTGKHLYVGIGSGQTAMALPSAYAEGREAAERSFFEGGQTVFQFKKEPPKSQTETGAVLEKIGRAVAAGEETAALELLEKLFGIQAKNASVSAARSEGLELVKLYGKQLAETEDDPCRGLRAEISGIRRFDSYRELLCQTVREACGAVGASVREPGIVADAQRYLAEHYCRAVTLGEVAAAVGANPSYLSRVFKSKTGSSLMNTVNKMKIEKAKALLAAGQVKVYEAAYAVGIDDTAYFSHLFRKYTGMTPKAFQDHP